MSPLVRFVAAAVLFHLALGGISAWLGWRWVQRLRKPRPAALWWLWLAADTVLFGTALMVLAVGLGAAAPYPVFSAVRLAAQGFFGEGFLLAAWIAALHVRITPAGLRWRALVPALTAVALLLIYADAYHHCPYDLHVRRYALDVTHGRPRAGHFRLVHLSDIQTHSVRPYEERVFRTAVALRPDLLIYTGDYVQRRLGTGPSRAARDFNALLRRSDLNPPLRAFAVRGDVERDDWRNLFAGARVRCLENESTRIALPGGRSMTIVGLDLHTGRTDDPQPVQRMVDRAPPADLRLVISHAPDFIRHLERRRVDLALAGHTHGGQIALPRIGPLVTATHLPNRYGGGFHLFQGIPLHVSRGIGMERQTAPQVRFFCPPEIAVIEIVY